MSTSGFSKCSLSSSWTLASMYIVQFWQKSFFHPRFFARDLLYTKSKLVFSYLILDFWTMYLPVCLTRAANVGVEVLTWVIFVFYVHIQNEPKFNQHSHNCSLMKRAKLLNETIVIPSHATFSKTEWNYSFLSLIKTRLRIKLFWSWTMF